MSFPHLNESSRKASALFQMEVDSTEEKSKNITNTNTNTFQNNNTSINNNDDNSMRNNSDDVDDVVNNYPKLIKNNTSSIQFVATTPKGDNQSVQQTNDIIITKNKNNQIHLMMNRHQIIQIM